MIGTGNCWYGNRELMYAINIVVFLLHCQVFGECESFKIVFVYYIFNVIPSSS